MLKQYFCVLQLNTLMEAAGLGKMVKDRLGWQRKSHFLKRRNLVLQTLIFFLFLFLLLQTVVILFKH